MKQPTELGMIQQIVDCGAIDDKTRDIFVDMAARIAERGVTLSLRQRAWVDKEYAKVPKNVHGNHQFTRAPSGKPVELQCGPLPLHPPGRPGNAPRFGR